MYPESTPPESPGYFGEIVEEEEEEDEDEDEEEEEEGTAEIEAMREILDDGSVEDENENENGPEGGASIIEILDYGPERDDAALVFSKHQGSVFCCDLDPTTNLLAVTGGKDDAAYVWEVQTGNVVLECTGHKDSVIHTSFSHDSSYVVSGDMSGLIQVWKLSTKTMVWSTTVEDLEWMKWHPGSNILLAAVKTGEVYMWKVPSGDCKVHASHGVETNCGIYMPDGRRAVIGYDDGVVRILDLKTMSVLHEVSTDFKGPVRNVSCHDNGSLIAACCGKILVIINAQTGQVISSLGQNEVPVSEDDFDVDTALEAVEFNHDPNVSLAITGDLQGDIVAWDTSKQALRYRIEQGCGTIKIVCLRHNPVFFTASLQGLLYMYNSLTGEALDELMGHSDTILDFACSADGKIIITASDDETARVFHINVTQPEQ